MASAHARSLSRPGSGSSKALRQETNSGHGGHPVWLAFRSAANPPPLERQDKASLRRALALVGRLDAGCEGPLLGGPFAPPSHRRPRRRRSAVAWTWLSPRRTHDRERHLGEFDAIGYAHISSRVRWTRFLALEVEARGIVWAYWEFGSWLQRLRSGCRRPRRERFSRVAFLVERYDNRYRAMRDGHCGSAATRGVFQSTV